MQLSSVPPQAPSNRISVPHNTLITAKALINAWANRRRVAQGFCCNSCLRRAATAGRPTCPAPVKLTACCAHGAFCTPPLLLHRSRPPRRVAFRLAGLSNQTAKGQSLHRRSDLPPLPPGRDLKRLKPRTMCPSSSSYSSSNTCASLLDVLRVASTHHPSAYGSESEPALSLLARKFQRLSLLDIA